MGVLRYTCQSEGMEERALIRAPRSARGRSGPSASPIPRSTSFSKRPPDRARCCLLQQVRNMRAVDQGRQRRDQVDAAVMQAVHCQCRSAPASCTRLQSRQFPAHAGDAGADQRMVADERLIAELSSHHQRQHETFDSHAFKGNRRKECVRMPRKTARSGPQTPLGRSGMLGAIHPLASGLPASSENAYHPRQFRVHLGNPGL
jgi:hypothetical protein